MLLLSVPPYTYVDISYKLYILHNSWIRLSDNVICVILLINWLVSCFFFYPSLKLFVWLLVIGWMLCIFSLTLHWKIAVIYNIYICVYIPSLYLFVLFKTNFMRLVGFYYLVPYVSFFSAAAAAVVVVYSSNFIQHFYFF